jgi:hypothetical protein
LNLNLSAKNNPRNKNAARKGSRLIRCECGFEILLLPDLQEMSKAIEEHAATHARKEKDPGKAAFVEARIQNLLITQTLDKAASP